MPSETILMFFSSAGWQSQHILWLEPLLLSCCKVSGREDWYIRHFMIRWWMRLAQAVLVGKAVSHQEHMSVTMGMKAWRKCFDEIGPHQMTGWFSQHKQQKQEDNEGCAQRTRKQTNSSLEKCISGMKGLETNLKKKIETIQYIFFVVIETVLKSNSSNH